MNDAFDQAVTFVRYQFSQGVPRQTIIQELASNGWDAVRIDHVMQVAATYGHPRKQPMLSAAERKRNRKHAILWFLSPFIFLVVAIALQFILGAIGISTQATMIVSILLGIIGVCLMLVGPIRALILIVRD